MKQFTKEQAIELSKSGEWLDWTVDERVRVQLFQDRLCMPFHIFHAALEEVLGRPVFTHELARVQLLRDEYTGNRPHPTFSEILNLIPKDKRIVIVALENNDELG